MIALTRARLLTLSPMTVQPSRAETPRLRALIKKSRSLDPRETDRILEAYQQPWTDEDLIYLENDLIEEIDCHSDPRFYFGENFTTGQLGKWIRPNQKSTQ